MRWLLLLMPGVVFAQGYRPQVSLQLDYIDVQAQLLGRTLSVNDMQLTAASPTEAAITLVGGARLYLVAPAVAANGYLRWNPDIGVSTPAALEIGPGASLFADSLYSRQGDRSVSIDQAHGLRLAPQTAIGACDGVTGAGHHREGDVKLLSGASLSARTRACVCTSDGAGSPAYAWRSLFTGTVGTSTVCND